MRNAPMRAEGLALVLAAFTCSGCLLAGLDGLGWRGGRDAGSDAEGVDADASNADASTADGGRQSDGGSSGTGADASTTVWLVALCNPTDTPAISEGRDVAFYQHLFADTGAGSVPDYWASQSYGRQIVISDVTPRWVSTGLPLAWHQAQEPSTNIEACIEAALRGGVTQDYFNYIAVYNGQVDLGSAVSTLQGKLVPAVIVDAYSPESAILWGMGHGFGLGNSFDDRGVERGDPYDLMSAMNVYATRGQYCVTPGGWFACDNGPGLNAWSRWQLGWLPRERRQMWWPANPGGTPLRVQDAILGARSEPTDSLPLILYVPASRSYMYSVEWIAADNYDRGDLYASSSPVQNPRTPADSLVIHRIKFGDATTYLVKDAGGIQTAAGNPFFDSSTGVHIELRSTQGRTATVRVAIDESNALWAKGAGPGAPPVDPPQVRWMGILPVAGDEFGASSALYAGYDPGVGELYPCRAWHAGGVHLGKASSALRWCSVSWEGKEVFADPGFQVLSLAPGAQAVWVDGADGSLPSGALAAGFDGDGTLFVCRAQVNGYWTPGKLVRDRCAVPWGGAEYDYRSYQVLIVQ